MKRVEGRYGRAYVPIVCHEPSQVGTGAGLPANVVSRKAQLSFHYQCYRFYLIGKASITSFVIGRKLQDVCIADEGGVASIGPYRAEH